MSLQTLRSNTRLLSALPYALLAIIVGGSLAIALGKSQDPKLIVALVGAGIGSILVFMRPKLGILIMAVITYANLSDILISFHHLPSIAQPFIALLLASVSLNWLYTRQRPSGWTRVLVWLLLHEVLIFVSLLYADNLTNAEIGLEDFTKNAIVALLVAIIVQDIKTLRYVIWALLAVAIFLGTISTYQSLTGTYDNSYWGFGRAGKVDMGDTTAKRVAGSFGDPNSYAQVCLFFIPLALDRVLHEKRHLLRAFAAWALFVSVLTVLWTFSRGSFLGLILMLAYMFVRRPPPPVVLAVILAVIASVSLFLPTNYTTRIETLLVFNPLDNENAATHTSFRGRTSENIVGWMMFRDHPFLGVGKGNYKVRYLDYSSGLGIDPRLQSRSAHNLYLEIASEQGAVGLLLFFAMLWYMFKVMRRSQNILSSIGHEEDANMVRSLEYCLVGYLITSIFLHMAFPRPFWFMVGLIMSTLHIAQNEQILHLKYQLSDLRIAAGLSKQST